MLRSILLAIALGAFTSAAQADEPSGAPPRPPGAWTLELGGEFTREAWNYNLSDEDLWGGSTSVWYRVTPGWSIGSEVLVIWVHQERVASTPIAGLSIAGRRAFRTRRALYFAEVAGGLSYAARFVPQRGTRFNYLAEAGAGVIRPVGRGLQLVTALRWLHVSNSGVAGRSRNPDIQALGVRVGVIAPLRRRTLR